MGFKSRSTALTVYQVTTTEPVTQAALQAGAFRPIDQTADAFGMGFVPFDDPMAADMDQAMRGAVHEKAHYVVVGFRIDSRRIPGAVLKRHVKEAIDAELLASGKKYLSKDRKADIKDAVKLRLMARSEPVPAVYDVALDRTTMRLFFSCTSARAKDCFEAFWFDRFGEKPLEESPYTLASEAMEPTGVDFLTAIYEGKEGGGEADDAAIITIQNKVTFLSNTTSLAVTSDNLSQVDDAMSTMPAVQVAKAKLRVELDGDEYDVTLSGDFSMAGLKTPKVAKPEEGDDPDGPTLERLFLIDKCVNAIHGAFKAFSGTYLGGGE